MDADGYFCYQARTDDMIISAGYNIAGPEVEDALLLHPTVAECAVIGVPDEERGQIVKAFVVLRAGRTPATATGARRCRTSSSSAIAPYKYPRAIEFRDALPRTETGKLQRFKLRERELIMATVHAFERPLRIRFAHCDPAGIVFFPQYLVMVNNLVEDWVDDALGVPYAELLAPAPHRHAHGQPAVRVHGHQPHGRRRGAWA